MIVGSFLYATPVIVLTRFASDACVSKNKETAFSSVKKSACVDAVGECLTYQSMPPTGYQLSVIARISFKPRLPASASTKSNPRRMSSSNTPGRVWSAWPSVMVCAQRRIVLSPASTASFICRTMCSRPGRGRCLNGGGASEAASSTSHWFQPAKTHGSPFRENVFPSPATRTNASETRHVVLPTWSDTSRPGSRALCAPPCICARNQDASWSRSWRAPRPPEAREMCEEDASSAVAREGKASTQKKSARTARKASLREESRARRVMFFSGRTAGSREGASMSAASMSAASSSWACIRARRSARHASARIAQFAKPRRVPRLGNERFR